MPVPVPDRPDAFTPVFGTRRGYPHADALAAQKPTDRARSEADQLCRDIASGELGQAVGVLNLKRSDVPTAPLLGQLVEAVVDALEWRLLTRWDIGSALAALRLSPHVEPRIIQNFDHQTPMLHLWPDDDQNRFGRVQKPARTFLTASVFAVTAGHERLIADDCAHMKRGDWDVAAVDPTLTRCPRCARYAQAFSETADNVERNVAREVRAALSPLARRELHLSVLDHISRGALRPSSVVAVLAGSFRTHVRAAAADRLCAEQEAPYMRLLNGYRGMQLRTFPLGLATLLNRDDWQQLVDRAFALAGTGMAAALIHTRVVEDLARLVKSRSP
jgi:hypothetical protein